MRWRINVLSLGDREAKLIGANIRLERGLMVVCATLLTASSVCLSGTIGWLGLVIPHLARLFIGDNNVKSLPLAGLIGAIFFARYRYSRPQFIYSRNSTRHSHRFYRCAILCLGSD